MRMARPQSDTPCYYVWLHHSQIPIYHEGPRGWVGIMGFKKPQYWGPFKYWPKRLNMVFRSCLITYWKKKDIIISSSAQYVTLRKYISHPSLVMYCFATPPIKLKWGQQIGGGLIANHLEQSLWWANQKHWAAVISYLLHFSAGAQWWCALYQPRQHKLGPNHFPEPNCISWIFFILFYCAGSQTKHRWRCSNQVLFWTLHNRKIFKIFKFWIQTVMLLYYCYCC